LFLIERFKKMDREYAQTPEGSISSDGNQGITHNHTASAHHSAAGISLQESEQKESQHHTEYGQG